MTNENEFRYRTEIQHNNKFDREAKFTVFKNSKLDLSMQSLMMSHEITAVRMHDEENNKTMGVLLTVITS